MDWRTRGDYITKGKPCQKQTALCSRQRRPDIQRLHAHQAQHEVDFTPVVDFVLEDVPNRPAKGEALAPRRVDGPLQAGHVDSGQVGLSAIVDLGEQHLDRSDGGRVLIQELGPISQLAGDDKAEPTLFGLGDVARNLAEGPQAFAGDEGLLIVREQVQGLEQTLPDGLPGSE
jgi:hypothetical protein